MKSPVVQEILALTDLASRGPHSESGRVTTDCFQHLMVGQYQSVSQTDYTKFLSYTPPANTCWIVTYCEAIAYPVPQDPLLGPGNWIGPYLQPVAYGEAVWRTARQPDNNQQAQVLLNQSCLLVFPGGNEVTLLVKRGGTVQIGYPAALNLVVVVNSYLAPSWMAERLSANESRLERVGNTFLDALPLIVSQPGIDT